MLEKAKEFIKKHDMELIGCAGGIAAFGFIALGYAMGYKTACYHSDVGLSACFLVKPELKPMLEEALEQVNTTILGKK